MKKRVLWIAACLVLSLSVSFVLAEGVGCGTGLTWSYDGGVLTVSGTGAMADYAADGAPWQSRKDEITEIVVAGGVTSVGANAFADCALVTGVTLPESLTAIGAGAFASCAALTEITIPAGVAGVGADAFASCAALRDAYLRKTDLAGYAAAASYCAFPAGCTVHLFSRVNFLANGGGGGTEILIVERNTDFDAPTDSFWLENAHIASWNTRADGTGDPYPAYEPIRTGAETMELTLYAQWADYVFFGLEAYDILNGGQATGGGIRFAELQYGTEPVPQEDLDGYYCAGQCNYGGSDYLRAVLEAEPAEGFRFVGWYEAEPVGGASQSLRPVSLLSADTSMTLELQGSGEWEKRLVAAFIPAFGEADFRLPEGITRVEKDAFAGIAAASIYVPDSCGSIASGAFAGCAGLRQIRLPKECLIDGDAFEGCGSLVIYAEEGGETETRARAFEREYPDRWYWPE